MGAAIIAFIVMQMIMIWVVLDARYPLKKLLLQDVIYVREAIFKSINKYSHATFEINNNGKREIIFLNAALRDTKPIRSGDKVIIVKVKGGAYIYHPRE